MRRRGDQEVAALGRQGEQATVDEVVEGVGYRQGLPGLDGHARARERAHDLERVEGVSARGLMHLRQQRSRQRDVEVGLHDLVQRREIERADVQVAAARGAPQLVDERALEARAAREQDTDVLALESSRGIRERPRGRRVEPLHVVDGDEEGHGCSRALAAR